MPFAAGQPSGPVEDVLTGFLDGAGNAQGRPVGVAVDRVGAVLLPDDVGNAIWRVAAPRAEVAQVSARTLRPGPSRASVW